MGMQRRRSLVKFLRDLRHLPTIIRMAAEVVEAQEDVIRRDYVAAERRLVRVYTMAPPGTVELSTTNLLMALVSLRLGNPSAAADLAPIAVSHVGSLRAFANKAERAYLQYAGRLIFEEATRQLGHPKTINVGVEFEDLDIRRVRPVLRDTYPVSRSPSQDVQKLH